MRRYLIFAILFPPIAFVLTFWVVLQIANWAAGGPTTFDYHQVVLLPIAYMLAIVPALLTAAVDDSLARRNVSFRILWTAFAGYVLIFLPLLASMKFMHGAPLLGLGILGAIPAAICSWVAGYQRKESVNA